MLFFYSAITNAIVGEHVHLRPMMLGTALIVPDVIY